MLEWECLGAVGTAILVYCPNWMNMYVCSCTRACVQIKNFWYRVQSSGQKRLNTSASKHIWGGWSTHTYTHAHTYTHTHQSIFLSPDFAFAKSRLISCVPVGKIVFFQCKGTLSLTSFPTIVKQNIKYRCFQSRIEMCMRV